MYIVEYTSGRFNQDLHTLQTTIPCGLKATAKASIIGYSECPLLLPDPPELSPRLVVLLDDAWSEKGRWNIAVTSSTPSSSSPQLIPTSAAPAAIANKGVGYKRRICRVGRAGAGERGPFDKDVGEHEASDAGVVELVAPGLSMGAELGQDCRAN
ncbi:hypothetical protein BDV93DRAFT_509513 [Ceratobasidium sp. AG-I]|nr:hypothetical protein BDV93DRAFT_509513 [Ceratobasidium sp. AG-I]